MTKDTSGTQAPAELTEPQAQELAQNLLEAMNALLGVVEKETELVRAGHLREAMALGPQKTEMSRSYVSAATRLKACQALLELSSPELLNALGRHHEVFQAMLKINLTVLATAHAVTEGLVRSVNTEMQRRNAPSTYTAAGRRATPGPRHMMPLAVSRSL